MGLVNKLFGKYASYANGVVSVCLLGCTAMGYIDLATANFIAMILLGHALASQPIVAGKK